MKGTKRAIACALGLVMLLTSPVTEAYAAKQKGTEGQNHGINYEEEHYCGSRQESIREDNKEDFQLPDIIKEDEAREKGYVGRDKDQERDLHTFVFENEDGSNTMKIYDYPVKYVDEEGDVRDISTDIEKKSDGSFGTKDNDIVTTFPRHFADGITLEHENIKFTMVPEGMDNASTYAANHVSATLDDEKSVSYYYGTDTTLEYELTYTGFKEDIVVEKYTGQTEYDFTLYTNGLYVTEEEGSFYLTDKNGKIQATIGDIIIFTADEKNNARGSMSSIAIKDGEEYLLTIHVDADYLKDKKTVYPIRIDPTIEINYSKNGNGAIADVTISSSGSSNGASGSLYVGKYNGISRVLMKFPTLSLSSVYSASDITSATVELRDLMCESTSMTVYCYAFNGNTWSESSVSWLGANPTMYTTLLSSNAVSYANGKNQVAAHRYKFDITAAVKGWKSGTYSQAKGIMFKAAPSVENGSTGLYKTFASYNRSSYRPSLSITYTARTSVTLSMDGNYVMVGKTKSISCLKFPTNLNISWTSSNGSVATVSNGVVKGIAPGKANIYATYINSATGGYTSKAITVEVVEDVGIRDNQEYYIMNGYSGRNMSLTTTTDSTRVNVNTQSRAETKLAQWKTEKQSDGSYQLLSVYSPSGKCLDIAGSNVDIYTDVGVHFQKFTICRVNSGTYEGLYLIRIGKYYVTQDTDYNVCLTTSANIRSYWSFMEVKSDMSMPRAHQYMSKIKAGPEESRIDTTDMEILFNAVMEQSGYDTNFGTNVKPNTAYTALKNSPNVWVALNHGSPGAVHFHDINYNDLGMIAVNATVAKSIIQNSPTAIGSDVKYIDSCGENAFASLRGVFYLCCFTGCDVTAGGKTYNLVDATYEKGAHFVMGTTRKVYVDEMEAFWDAFLGAVEDGKNVAECIEYGKYEAKKYLREGDGEFIYYRGDTKQYLNE